MLPVLLLWLYRKYSKNLVPALRSLIVVLLGLPYFLIAALLFFLLLQKNAAGQTLQFHVLKGKEAIGWLTVSTGDEGAVRQISVQSHLDFRILFRYQIDVTEEVALLDNQIQSALLLRTMNGEEKIKRSKIRSGNKLEVIDAGQHRFEAIPRLEFHVLQLYLKEPVGIKEVYSEKFQQAVPVQQNGPHSYILSLPDGNQNIYYYTNGACTRIRITSTFFSAEIVKR